MIRGEAIIAHLGKKWEIMNAGFKPYPVCAFNQTPVIAMIDLLGKHRIDTDRLKGFRLG